MWLAAAVVLLRRLPVFYLLSARISPIKRPDEALFAGWFGPLGVAAMFYAMLSMRKIDQPQVWVITGAVVAASILVHGITATPLTHRFGRRRPKDR